MRGNILNLCLLFLLASYACNKTSPDVIILDDFESPSVLRSGTERSLSPGNFLHMVKAVLN